PFIGSGFKTIYGRFVCIESPVFRVKQFVDCNCVELELLLPASKVHPSNVIAIAVKIASKDVPILKEITNMLLRILAIKVHKLRKLITIRPTVDYAISSKTSIFTTLKRQAFV